MSNPVISHFCDPVLPGGAVLQWFNRGTHDVRVVSFDSAWVTVKHYQ